MDDNKSNENAFKLLKSSSSVKMDRKDIDEKERLKFKELLNNCLEDIFCFSLIKNNSSNINDGRKLYLLKHLSQSSETKLLGWEDLDNALLERLGIYDSQSELNPAATAATAATTTSTTSTTSTFNRLNYLVKCYSNCRAESLSKNYQMDVKVINEILIECRQWIIRYSITYMLEPEVFNSMNADFEKYELILSFSRDKDVSNFLTELRLKAKSEELNVLLAPALFVVVGKLKLYELCVTDPEYIDAADILSYFTSDEEISKVFVSSPTFLPPCDITKASAKEFSMDTFLGLLFGAVCTDSKRDSPIYFNVSQQNNNDIYGITISIQNSLMSIYDRVVQSFKRLLAHSKLKDPLYIWLHYCLLAHSDRCKLGTSLFLNSDFQTHDGFFVNLSYVAFKIFTPIANDWSKIINRVSYDYYKYSHRWNDLSSNNTYCVAYNNLAMLFTKEKEKEKEETKQEENTFNFATHWYYLTHEILKIGIVPAMDKYTKYMETLQNLNQSIENSEVNEEKEEYKYRMTSLISEQLCLKAQLINPVLMDMLVEFISASCVHFLNMIGYNLSTSSSIPSNSPLESLKEGADGVDGVDGADGASCDVFLFVPEFILDQLATCVIFLLRFSIENLIKFDDRLYSIVFCFSIFMGSNQYIKNPHLRAKLAQVLHMLIASEEMNQFTVMLPIRTLFQNNHRILSIILPKQLIKLFVDIEFTGHAYEFHQKFSYRYYMYKILFYIWDLPEFLQTLHLLSEEAENVNMKLVPLFLKFINLLINDSTYLLDEALSLLSKIHEIEVEMNTPQWISTSKEDKIEKLKLLETSRDHVTSYNILSLDTVKTLLLLSKDMPKPFFSLTMVDRIASMLNYFLHHLVGEKKRELKVKDMDKLSFDPKKLVSMICETIINLSEDERFLTALVEDERSFSINLLIQALEVLKFIMADALLIEKFCLLKQKLNLIHKNISENNMNIEEDDDIPEEFIDPISYSLMRDPVLLPESKKIVDRTTITKHLLSDEKDPFNRAHLTISMLIPQPELKQKIDEWLILRKQCK